MTSENLCEKVDFSETMHAQPGVRLLAVRALFHPYSLEMSPGGRFDSWLQVLCSHRSTGEKALAGEGKHPQIRFLAPPQAVKTQSQEWNPLGQGSRNLQSACGKFGKFLGKWIFSLRNVKNHPCNPTPTGGLKTPPPTVPGEERPRTFPLEAHMAAAM